MSADIIQLIIDTFETFLIYCFLAYAFIEML